MNAEIDVQTIEDLRDAFHAQCRQGAGPSIETAMAAYQGIHWRLMLTSLIAIEVAVRRENGECPLPAEYEHRFPRMAAYVRLAFGQRSVPRLFPVPWMRWFLSRGR